MTDIHVQPENRAAEGFRKAIDKVNLLNPDFVITGGDLIMDALGQTKSRSDSLYNLYQDLMTLFKMPVYNTLGNHEVFGLYEKSGISPEKILNMESKCLKTIWVTETPIILLIIKAGTLLFSMVLDLHRSAVIMVMWIPYNWNG